MVVTLEAPAHHTRPCETCSGRKSIVILPNNSVYTYVCASHACAVPHRCPCTQNAAVLVDGNFTGNASASAALVAVVDGIAQEDTWYGGGADAEWDNPQVGWRTNHVGRLKQ